MITTVITAKGLVLIPSKVRRRLNMKGGTKLCVLETSDGVELRPLTREYFEKHMGILGTKGKLTKALMEEKAKEKEIEDKKWSKS